MSKNVAVFVDVANIFYAAKAAGVDIDYVTLLKSAIAGRDFVRAYAYTGLDPDNENQRQFHSFLARNGYKVVSKDIRKYGDGRIKANLDIELVVDLMRLARNLDIAVVVSGDGDFAPAIRAVQQMGVRVEVVSFRGNTSSDLIEVADSFADIAQIARVEKGSARSGRRVAAEGDLSMTEVPEKETEGVPRRQRGRRQERQPAAAAADIAGNLIVLPGERLSRAGDDEELAARADAEEASAESEEAGPIEAVDAEEGAATGVAEELGDEGRRRRRRRGGRGRGRGRRAEVDVLAGGEPSADEDDEEFEDVAPAPPHHTFGSVWDTQLGVPSAPLGTTVQALDDDEELEEPEIPEYMLAERRQRGQRGRGRLGGRGRAAGYQAALDRERFGRGAPNGGFGGQRTAERSSRGDRQRGGRQQQRPGRGDRQPQQRGQERAPAVRAQPSAPGVPWSEVPPEVEELLRAELARKSEPGPAEDSEGATETGAVKTAEPDTGEVAQADKPKRATRRRTTTATAAAEAEGETVAGERADKPKRATRRRTTKSTTEAADEGETVAGEQADKPKRATRRRTMTATAAAEAEGETDAGEQADKPKRATRRRTTKSTTEAADEG